MICYSVICRRKKFAHQDGRRILPCLLREALGERGDGAFGEIEFYPLHAMHGEEHDAGGKGFAVADLRDEIIER